MEEKRRISGTSRTAGASSSTDTPSSHDETKKEKPWESGRVVASDSPYTRCAVWEEHGGGIEALLARVIQNPTQDLTLYVRILRTRAGALPRSDNQEELARARADGMPVYLESSAVAIGVYEKLGFEAIDGFKRRIAQARATPSASAVYAEICMLWNLAGAGELAPRRSRLQVCSAEGERTRERTVDISVIPGVFIWDSRAGGVCFFFFFLFRLSSLYLHLWSM